MASEPVVPTRDWVEEVIARAEAGGDGPDMNSGMDALYLIRSLREEATENKTRYAEAMGVAHGAQAVLRDLVTWAKATSGRDCFCYYTDGECVLCRAKKAGGA
jgi:hypothetical protein